MNTLHSFTHTVRALVLAGVASVALFSSCMDEPTPSDGYTQKQFDKNLNSPEGSFWAIPSTITYLGNDFPTEYGWPNVMHVRDVMTDDYTSPETDYDHYRGYARGYSLGQERYIANFVYETYYRTISAANTTIKGFTANLSTLSNKEKGMLGAAYAFRAMSYLDLARMFEFLPTEFNAQGTNVEGNVVKGLTVPILTDNIDRQQTFNLPRAPHAEMLAFLLADLDQAEALTPHVAEKSADIPHLGVVYGLKARTYLWDGQYDKAAEYARKAIDEGYEPLTEAQWLDRTSGFNSANNGSWMLSASYNKSILTANKNLTNWTGWLSAEGQFGYAGLAGVTPLVASKLYDKIADTDFRKLSFKAPEDHALAGKTPFIDDEVGASLPEYAAVKFRPGAGELYEFQTAAAVSVPLMRVEEMLLIEAEAKAHTNPAEGLALLNTFMTKYRDKTYNCTLTSSDALVQEIILQKRIELWGEGQTFFDIKRLNLSVDRAYEGTNFPEATQFRTQGRPAWMNFVLPRTETLYNSAATHYNNPDPSNLYTPVK